MTTFNINRDNLRVGTTPCFYKFHIKNRTKASQIKYDFYEIISGVFVRRISGKYGGVIKSGNEVIINFDIDENGIEKESVSLINIGGVQLHVRFGTGGGVGAGIQQYINILGQNNFNVTQDTSSFNEVNGNGFRVTVDGGGENKETMNIFFQIYDSH